MSDDVDDLHAAEDEAGRYGFLLKRVAEFASAHPWTGLGDAYNYEGYESLLDDIKVAAIDMTACNRPTCEYEDGEWLCGEFCGCQGEHEEPGHADN